MTTLTCKQSFDCTSLQIFSKKSNFQNHWIALTPPPTPGKVWGSDFFPAKMRGKDELTGTRNNFISWLRVFEHLVENCLGGGCKEMMFIHKAGFTKQRVVCDNISSRFCKSFHFRPPCWFPLCKVRYKETKENVPKLLIEFIPQYQNYIEWQEQL